MIDRTLNTIVKDVILKGIVIVYSDFSPTKIRKAAIKKMLMADEFIAKNGVNIAAEDLTVLEAQFNDVAEIQLSVTTGWRDVIIHPVKTYTGARRFKESAGKLLDAAISASSQATFKQCREAQQHAEDTVQHIHGALTCGASLNAPATHGNVAAPATSALSTPASAHPGSDDGGANSLMAYIRFGDSAISVGPNTRAKLEFDRDTFTMVLFPNHSSGPATIGQPASARMATRTASVFTATGTARLISQPQSPKPDASSDDLSQSDGDDNLSVCMFEWLDGPVITALTGDEGTTDSGSDSD